MVRPPPVVLGLGVVALLAGCEEDPPKVEPAETAESAETADPTGGGTWYPDQDGDGYGDANDPGTDADEAPSGYALSNTDCDDQDPSAYPGASEECDGVDNDCDGEVDDGALETFYTDADGDGYGDEAAGVQSCEAPENGATTGGDCNDGDDAVYPGAAETCDGVDEDCDGEADEGVETLPCYPDIDGDGYGDYGTPSICCALGEGWVETDKVDCDDDNRTMYPGAREVCNLADDDCDGAVDEDDGLCDLWGEHVLSDADVRFVGAPGDSIGSRGAIASVDADGDGYDDLWIGGEDSYVGGDDVGVAYLLKGPLLTSGYSYELAEAILVGAIEETMAGSDVEDAGDVDGDGYADVWVGASGPGTGSVLLVLGPVSGTRSLSDPDLSWYPHYDESDSLYGATLGAGDFDGDEVPDLVIGASLADGDRSAAGKAWIARLDGAWGERYLTSAAIELQAEHEYDRLGIGATMSGSTTGDGIDDVLVSAWLQESGEGTGVVWILEETPDDGTYVIADLADAAIYGETPEIYAGANVADLGDMNEDGYTDYGVGSTAESTGAPYAGAIYVVYGPTGDRATLAEADAKFLGVKELAKTCMLAGGGDVNGDGHLDLAAGGYGNTSGPGTAFLVLGPLEGGTSSLSEADASFDGEVDESWAGDGLSISGDTNKDGYNDLVVGASGFEESRWSSEGAVYLYFGQPF